MSAQFRPRATLAEVLDALHLVTGCVIRQLLDVSPNRTDPRLTYLVGFGQAGEPVALREAGGGSRLLFDLKQWYRFDETTGVVSRRVWQPSLVAYEYRLLDRFERELLVYHWQPGPELAGPDHPHLHVSASLSAQADALTHREIALDKRHVATGWVSLAAVVRMLVEEFGVAPLHADWGRRLSQAESAPPAYR